MTMNYTPFLRMGLLAATTILATACVGFVPVPSSDDATSNKDAVNSTSASLCNIEGTQEQNLSEGTTKAGITQSCEETVVYIENQNPDLPKRCNVQIGEKTSELYIQPGERRSLTQTGPAMKAEVKLRCVNIHPRTK